MSKCASNCGQEPGFLRSGICPDCVRDIAAMQKRVARLRQMEIDDSHQRSPHARSRSQGIDQRMD